MFLSRPINGGFILGFYSRPRKQLFKFYGNGPDNIVKNRFQTFSVSTLMDPRPILEEGVTKKLNITNDEHTQKEVSRTLKG